MKKLLATIVCLIISTPAIALLDEDPDSMGIYFDQNADVVCTFFNPFVMNNAYVCLTNASAASGVSGFEFHVDVSPLPAYPMQYVFPAASINVATPPDFVCGLAYPLPWSPSIVLLTIQIMPFDYQPIYFTLTAVTPSSFGGFPGYAVGADPGDLRACGYSVGGPDICAIANPRRLCDVVGVENSTWGSVKSMYR